MIDRFRSLPMWKPAILVGRSVTGLLTATLCAVIVIAIGPAVGWRRHDVAGAVAGLALFLLFSHALSWACACIGRYSRDAGSIESGAALFWASGTPAPLVRPGDDRDPLAPAAAFHRCCWHELRAINPPRSIPPSAPQFRATPRDLDSVLLGGDLAT